VLVGGAGALVGCTGGSAGDGVLVASGVVVAVPVGEKVGVTVQVVVAVGCGVGKVGLTCPVVACPVSTVTSVRLPTAD
jgi:hypothetical protein